MEAITTNDPSGEGVEFRRSAGETIDRIEKPARAGLVCPDLKDSEHLRTLEARQAEFEGLARAIRLDLIFSETVRVREIKPATYLGGGTVEMLAERVERDDIELLLIDAQLTPIQQRNLERATGAKVVDRTALILEIFGARAATREGVLQVELAHLNYQRSRLVRSWTHLERQRGGGGFLGGPGETQIESDRRQLQDRISLLEKRLEKVRRTRGLQRKNRDAVPYPIVALVGYTNAGKSSLFNNMTGAEVMAQNLLFATLDTTVRKLDLPHGRPVMLSDTVGFVADLPTDLVAAFRATLEEVTDADVILHVRDVSNPDHAAQAGDVMSVLADLGITAENTPIIEVWNKIDLLAAAEGGEAQALTAVKPAGNPVATVPVSAATGEGVDRLLLCVEAELAKQGRTFRVTVPHENSRLTGWLYKHAEVLEREEPDETGTVYKIRIQPKDLADFQDRFRGNAEKLDAA